MAILVDKATKVICQGITGSQGTFHTQQAVAYGTQVVGGVTPGKGGSKHPDPKLASVPIFDTVMDAKKKTGANATSIYRAAALCRRCHPGGDRCGDAADRVHHRGHPRARHGQGQARARRLQVATDRAELSGRAHPQACKIGIMPANIFKAGSVGIVSRSGTLTYEAVKQTTDAGLGQSTAVGIGGDPVKGTEFIDVLEMFLADPATTSIIMIGEIGGAAEENAAEFIKDEAKKGRKKPMAGFIAGMTAPPGRRMGHAGAIISGGKGKAEDKVEAMQSAGIAVADSPAALGTTLAKVLSGGGKGWFSR